MSEAASAPQTASVILLQGIGKVFGRAEHATRALWQVDLCVTAGEFLAIAGPSGCGKSTLLSIMGLLEKPTCGSYQFRGRPVECMDASVRAYVRNLEMGFVFQAFNLISDLTVFENVELPLKYRSLDARVRKGRTVAALDRVGIIHKADNFPQTLSGGEQQRVAVARAIVGEPAIVFADEPTGNLDSANGKVIMDLLAELNRFGTTVCLVTHDPRFSCYANRTVHLLDGMTTDSLGK